jgi:hypothetical protein
VAHRFRIDFGAPHIIMSNEAFAGEARRLGAKFGQRCVIEGMTGSLAFPLAAVAVMVWKWGHDLHTSLALATLATLMALLCRFLLRPLAKPPAKLACPACGRVARLKAVPGPGSNRRFFLECPECGQNADTGLTIGPSFAAGAGVLH